MDFKYIYSSNRESLNDSLYKHIEYELEEDTDIPVILLTRNKEFTEKSIRKFGIIDKNLRLKIISLEDIVNICMKNSTYKNYKLLTNSKKSMVIMKLLEETSDIKEYMEISDSVNMATLFSNTIKLLKEDFKYNNELRSIIELIEDSSTKKKLMDVEVIYRLYENYKRGKYIDYEDALIIAQDIIAKSDIFNKAKIYIADFERLTNIEEKLLKILIKQSSGTIVALNTDNIHRKPTINSGHFYKIDNLVKRLNRICEDSNIPKREDIKIESNTSSEILHINEYLYKYPFEKYSEPTEYLTITEYESMTSEVENIAFQISKLLNTGVDYHKIKVLAFNLNEYESLISSIFKKFEVPVTIPTNTKIATKPIIKFIICLSNLYLNNYLSTDIIKYLKLTNNFSLEDICIMENYLISLGNERIDLSEDTFNTLEKNIDTEIAFRIYEQMQAVKQLFEELDKEDSLFNKSVTFYNEIIKLYFGDNVELDGKLEQSEIEAWNNFVNVISSIANIYEDNNRDTGAFLNILKQQLLNISIKNSDINVDSIEIIDNKDIGIDADYIFLLNANDGIISFKEEDDSLIGSLDKKVLLKNGVKIGESEEELILLEQYSMYKLMTSANKNLSISIPKTDRTEGKLKHSPVITRVKQLFPNSTKYEEYVPTILNEQDIITPISNKVSSEIIANMINAPSSPDIYASLNEFKNITDSQDEFEILNNAFNFSNSAQCLDKYSLNELYFDDTFSVSKLERFNNCPFSYFLEYGLGIKEEDKLIPDARHRGIFIHEIVEEFCNLVTLKNIDWSEVDLDFIKEEVYKIVSKIIKSNPNHILLSSEKYKNHINRLIDISIISIEAISRHIGNSFFEILGSEITFGDKSSYPPIIIKLDNGKKVKLRGQIDRADFYETNGIRYIRIVDYKTGNTKLNFSDIYNGLQLQLITYLDAILNASKDKDITYKPAGVFYLKMDKPFIKTITQTSDEAVKEARLKEMRMNGVFSNESNIPKLMDLDVYDGISKSSLNINARFKMDGTLMKATPGLSSQEFEDVIKYTKNIIKETITNMLDGNIDIKPIQKSTSTPCNYCKYKMVCLFDETLNSNTYKAITQLNHSEALDKIRKKVISYNERN